MKLTKITYSNLNSRQKENYNFQKIAAALADYGFYSMWLNDDWEGADFIAVHIDGFQMLRVQLKGRITIDSKYLGKDIFIAFADKTRNLYLYPHDEIFDLVTTHSPGAMKHGARSINHIPKWLTPHLAPYML
jgi:hypothetical protein